MRRLSPWTFGLAAAALVLATMQLVPAGHGRSNPAVVQEPAWDSPATRTLARQACFDCHSNETTWPAYSRFAPMSWLIDHHVNHGRAALNFSEWHLRQKNAADAADEVMEGEMPPATYRWMHPAARLSDADRQRLASGLAASFGGASEKRTDTD